jgi:hypothetical protein
MFPPLAPFFASHRARAPRLPPNTFGSGGNGERSDG